MCFVRISEQEVIISLHGINWLVCITEKMCVYCSARIQSLNVIHIYFIFMYVLLLPQRQTGEAWEPYKKQYFFSKIWELWVEK